MAATTVHSSIKAEPTASANRKSSYFKTPQPSVWQGLMLAIGLAVVASLLGKWLPVIGGPIFAIVLGLILRNSIGVPVVFRPGLGFASKQVLQWSIIALGFGLSLNQVAQVGFESIGVTLTTMAAAFSVALLLGRFLGIPDKLRSLIGAGTAICGGSAIAALAPIIKPEDHETAFAISTIFLFNVAAVLVFPFFGHLLQMSDVGFGLWAGTAINDTSSVVAAAYSYSEKAGDYATIVKLTRATFIIPICLFYVAIEIYQQKKSGTGFSVRRLIPWFIVWFVVASAIRSTGVLPAELLGLIQELAKFLMVVALAAVGLSSNMRTMKSTGWQPVLLGLGVWIAVAITSLAVQWYGGTW